MDEKIGIVVSEYNADITELMREIAEEHIKFLGAKTAEVIKVPGAFEIPLAAKKLAEKKEIDGIVTLGAVIEGDTSHDEVIAATVAKKISDITVSSGKPISLGISGPGMTRADGVKRIEGYSKRAVEATVKMIRMMKRP